MKHKVLIAAMLTCVVLAIAATPSGTTHECVIVSGYPDYPNNWDWNALTLNVSVVTRSTGAPAIKYGDNYAQTIANLLNQGYQFQGPPRIDEYGYGTTAVLVK